MDFVLREDFFLDEGDLTADDERHVERLTSTYGVVDKDAYPGHVLDLFCILRVENVHFYCYRSLVQSLREANPGKITVIPRGFVGPVYTQGDLMQCLHVKNIIDHVI
jgi:hypothetical protein